MAAVTLQAVINANRSVTVTRSTNDGIGLATAALVVDSTAGKHDVQKAVEALERALSRDFSAASTPAGLPTSGTSIE